MRLYEQMQNILGNNILTELNHAITETNIELAGLIKERMCKVYNSVLYANLQKRHILAKLVNTLDLGLNYEHLFVLVYDKEYMVVDLTFLQFPNKDKEIFKKLLEVGYQEMNDNLFNSYLRNIENNDKFFLIEDVFYDLRKAR